MIANLATRKLQTRRIALLNVLSLTYLDVTLVA